MLVTYINKWEGVWKIHTTHRKDHKWNTKLKFNN